MRALRNGEKLCHLDAYNRFGVSTLSMYIKEIKDSGINVKSKPIGDSRYLIYYIDR